MPSSDLLPACGEHLAWGYVDMPPLTALQAWLARTVLGGSVWAIRLLPALLGERGYFTAAVDNIGRWIQPAFDRYDEYPRWDHDGSHPWRNGSNSRATRWC